MSSNNYTNNLKKDWPYIIVRNRRIIEVNQKFLDMTEYNELELVGDDLLHILKKIRVGPSFDIENIKNQSNYFFFTKSLKIKSFNIKEVDEAQEKLYFFLENNDLNIDEKFPFVHEICSDDYYGIAVYSIPEIILLEANEKYVNFIEEPFNKRENCIGKHIWEIKSEYKGSEYERIWNHVIDTRKMYKVDEYMYDSLNRGITYWRIVIIPLLEDDDLKYCVIMLTEITEQVLHRKKVEEQARIIEEQNRKLEAIIENASDGMFLFNADNSVTFLNEESKKFVYNVLNYKQIGDSYSHTKYFDKDGAEITLDEMPGVRALRGENIKEFFLEARRPDKIFYYTISAKPMGDNKGNLTSALLCCRDITELVNKEKKIVQQKEQLETILDSISDAIMVFNAEGKLIILNSEAQKMYPSLISKSVTEIQAEYKYFDIDGNCLDPKKIGMVKAFKGEKVKNEKVVMIGKGTNRIVELNASPIFDENKHVTSIVLSHRDITERIRQQQQLLNSERERNEAMERSIEMKDDFLSMISHEFRTPINVISTAIQAINFICEKDLTDNLRKYLNTIRQNTFRQLRLVNNLLDITRADAGRIKIHKANIDMVFLTKSIVESVYTYALQKRVKIMFMTSIKKIIVGIDDEKYERILLNLLSNAIKFTPEGKNITVKLYTAKDNLYIEVKDEGIGIPKDKIDEVFKRFGQVDSSLSRQAEGAGIGLSLVKRFVEVLDGTISVRSKEGHGSNFTIKFPCYKVIEELEINPTVDLLDNRLIHSTRVEFSDIYL